MITCVDPCTISSHVTFSQSEKYTCVSFITNSFVVSLNCHLTILMYMQRFSKFIHINYLFSRGL